MHEEKKSRPELGSIKHVVWDWNGTLLDDTWLCIEIANQMLAARNLPTMSVARYQEVFDFPVVTYYERMGFDFTKESFEKLGAEFMVEYERRRDECGLHAEARHTLETIHARGLTQSVLSNYPHHTLEEILCHHNVRAFFDDVTGADNVYARGKTDRGHQWLARSKHHKYEVILIGDTLHDHEVAHAMGIRSALVTIGSHARNRLSKTGAPVFDSLGEFVAALG